LENHLLVENSIIYYVLFIIYYLLFIMYYLLIIIYYVLQTGF